MFLVNKGLVLVFFAKFIDFVSKLIVKQGRWPKFLTSTGAYQ